MSTRPSSSHDPVASLLRWLSFGGAREEEQEVEEQSAAGEGEIAGEDEAAADANPVREARRMLLDSVSEFLLANDLEILPRNLAAAHEAFSGLNPRLARKIDAMRQRGEKITQRWLDEATCQDQTDSQEATIEQLMARIETNLEAFARNTRTARNAASDYNTELEQHVATLEEVQAADEIIANLADLARAMLERSRKVEGEMRRSEDEAKALRQRLGRAKRDAEIDYLTGLPNRRAFEAVLAKDFVEAREAGDPLCIALCDIDHFKRVNDTHGHDAGDRVIRVVARALAEVGDANCHVARHGGEEFVILFRGVSIADAFDRLDSAREQMAARSFVNRTTDRPIGQVTFSGGLVSMWSHPDPRTALAAADEALYRAKENGRNRIVMA